MFSDRLAKLVVFLGATAALLAVNETSLAQTQATGTVTVYHLNPAVTGRGACIQMAPALQSTWACVYSSNNDGSNNDLYNEMNDLLSDALFQSNSLLCTIVYETSNLRIDYAECH